MEYFSAVKWDMGLEKYVILKSKKLNNLNWATFKTSVSGCRFQFDQVGSN